ncbi:hypothetical protein T11_1808 [Trichinella zimbabwensis]|uniref:Uncharacterized protein n=1 Tax=Trichinella zimbabwensis TaxID=268475 RepID=A0A0V1HAK6_9BILA|nr:hypothetical protein T11_1808 [Trichinella zimbabwensis]
MSCAVCQALQETKYSGSNTSESSLVDKNNIIQVTGLRSTLDYGYNGILET